MFNAYAGNRLVSTSLAVPLNFTLLQYLALSLAGLCHDGGELRTHDDTWKSNLLLS